MANEYQRLSRDNFHNVDGVPIVMQINYKDNKDVCVEITITADNYNRFYKKIYILLVLLIFNGLLFYNNIINNVFYIGINVIVIFFITRSIINTVANEQILLLKPLGLQYTVTYNLGFRNTSFIPWDTIRSVFINEVITMQRILYVLTILRNDGNDESKTLIPILKHTNPELACLEIIYNKMKEIFSGVEL